MTSEQLHQIVQNGETLDIEFKGEEQAPLNDRDLVEAVVCLCNRPGNESGYLLVGVEDDGRITGARSRHGQTTHPQLVQALVANRTRPSQSCRVQLTEVDGKQVLVVEVPPSRTPVGTADGKHVRRAMGSRGTPECLPYHFHEMQAALSDRQMQDFSDCKSGERPVDGSGRPRVRSLPAQHPREPGPGRFRPGRALGPRISQGARGCRSQRRGHRHPGARAALVWTGIVPARVSPPPMKLLFKR